MNWLSQIWNRLLPAAPRRRSNRSPVSATAALEFRELLAATLGEVTSTYATELWGIRRVMATDGKIIAVGSSHYATSRLPGVQTIDIATGASDVQYFRSLAGAEVPASDDETVYGPEYRGWIDGVQKLSDGRIVYVGKTASSHSYRATYWFTPDDPRTVVDAVVESDATTGLYDVAVDGTASYGNATLAFTNLMEESPVSVYHQPYTLYTSVQISADGAYAVSGGRVVRRVGTSGLQYEIVDPAFWQSPPEGLVSGNSKYHVVAVGDGRYVFADTLINTETFVQHVAVWDETGTLLGITAEGDDSCVGIAAIHGEVFIGVNSADGAAVYNVADMSHRIDLSVELGTQVYFADEFARDWRYAMFNNHGELGVVLGGPLQENRRIVSFAVEPDAFTVESAIHQGNYAANVLSLGTKTFEVGLKGSATFDVTKIDKATLFIGDERNTVSGKIISIKYTDENKDGFRDAIIKVQTSSALRADTTRLKVTGRTLTGEEFDGGRTFAMTAQSWQAHWQATSGSGWRTIFDAYKRGLKRTWW